MGTAANWLKRAAVVTGAVFVGSGVWLLATGGGRPGPGHLGDGPAVIAALAVTQGLLYAVPNRFLAAGIGRVLVYLVLTMFPPFLAAFILVHQYMLHSFQLVSSARELAGLVLVAAASLCSPLSLLLYYRNARKGPGEPPT